jgi:tRNA A37 N6-isopentenylltransferase MiaA
MTEERPQVIVLVGPTAVGKTETVLHLTTVLPLEIINADSMQVYRYMNIGTAKASATERALVPHHLLDLVDPDEDFNAYRYRDLGRGTVAEVWRIHRRDLVRIIRALEVWECSGRPISAWQREHGFREHPFRVLKIGLSMPRSELYARTDARVQRMMAQGLQEEVAWLLERGYGPELKSMQSLGYRHLVRYLTGRTGLAEAVATMKRDTRRYAKRQMTWFGCDPEIRWIHASERERITRLALAFLEDPDDQKEEDLLGRCHETVDNAP